MAALAELGVELILYARQPIHRFFLDRLPVDSFVERVAPPMRYLAWEQHWLPRQCARDCIDVVHSPYNYGLPWSSPCPRVLTLHDAIYHVFAARRSLREWSRGAWIADLLHWIARTRAERVITVSQHSKGDLVRFLKIPEPRIAVTYEAADPRFHLPVSEVNRRRIRSQHRLERPYFFYIGGWEPRKNIPFLLEGFAESGINDAELVLAGGSEEGRADLVKQAQTLGIAERLRLLSWIEDEDLPALYAEALAFVYPSRYEGFGLQICEAMAVGCPVLAARATSLPEVLGDGGEIFSLDATTELAEAMCRVCRDPEYRMDLSARGQARAATFTWQRTAEQTIAVYFDALGRTSSQPCAPRV